MSAGPAAGLVWGTRGADLVGLLAVPPRGQRLTKPAARSRGGRIEEAEQRARDACTSIEPPR